MTDRTSFQFGEETVAELTAIGGITPQIVEKLRQACELVDSPIQRLTAGKKRKELEKLSTKLRRLSDVLVTISPDSYLELMRQRDWETPTNALTVPNVARSNLDILQIRQGVIELGELSTRTMARLSPKPGTQRLEKMHLVAELAGLQLRLGGILLTKSPTDTYMVVLELLFAEIHPTPKSTAHLRYGADAISRIGFHCGEE